jgi:transposase
MTGKNTKRSRRKYDASFKEDVLKMISSGRSVGEISQALGIGTNLIYRWVKLSNINSNSSPSNDSGLNSNAEVDRLKAELRRTEQERDILKKALAIFSRGT